MTSTISHYPSILSGIGKHALDYSIPTITFNEEGELLIEIRIPSWKDDRTNFDVLFLGPAVYFVEEEETSMVNEIPRPAQIEGIGILENSTLLDFFCQHNQIFRTVQRNAKHYVLIGGDRVCHILAESTPVITKRN